MSSNEAQTETAEVVLVVDDHPDALDQMAQVLQDEGLEVLRAENGARALEILQESRVDLIVTDVVMDGIDGRELCRRVKADQRLARVPVVFVTGRTSFEEVADLFDVGAAEFISKPYKPHEFIVRVRNVLRNSRRETALLKRTSLLERTAEAHAKRAAHLERFSADVVSSLHAWLLVLDGELRLRFTNQAFCHYREEEAEALEERDVCTLLPPSLLQNSGFPDAVRRVQESRQPERLSNIRFQDKGGAEHVVDIRLNPIDFSGGQGVLAIIMDVTERWHADEAIREEKRKIEDIVHGMGGSLALLDQDLHVLWANKTFETWFGPLQGQRFEHALHGLNLNGRTDPNEIFTEREHHSQEWEFITSDGLTRYYRNIVVPTRDSDGRLRELVLVTQDLTEITLRAQRHLLLRDLSTLLQSTLDQDRLLYILLTCVTAGHALGFNRAFLFLVDESQRTLKGVMGVGPASREEAFRIWSELAGQHTSLLDLAANFDNLPPLREWPLTKLLQPMVYHLDRPGVEREIIARTAQMNEPQRVTDAAADERVTATFRERFGSHEFICVPLQAKGRVVGVVMADNIYSGQPLSHDQIDTLALFAGPAGLAIENAQTYAELKLRMDQLRKAQDALVHAEKLATVGSLAAHVAHEIRNPLVTIGGFAHSMLRRPDDAVRVERNARIIHEEVLRLERILGDVMDFSKPTHPDRAMHNINDIVLRVAEILGDELNAKGVRLRLTCGDVPPCPVDEQQVFQVLLNLVRNGVDSMAENIDGREKRVEVRTFRSDASVHVRITDTGAGIAPELIPRLFDPFFTTKTSGTGLGLAVTRKIVQDHGGDIDVESRPGQGSAFTLTFPLEAVAPPHLEHGRETDAETAKISPRVPVQET